MSDPVSVSIDQELTSLSDTPFQPFISKVRDDFRTLNVKAYEPNILAIGPYHHGKHNLKMMEGHKLRYLKQLLSRRNESSVDRYIVALRELEEIAHQCYEVESSISSLDEEDKFLRMMLLDGFFIIELFRKFSCPKLIDQDDPIFYLDQDAPSFHLDQIEHALRRDLLLFENQIPFFILAKLFDMTRDLDPPNKIIDLAVHFLKVILPGQSTTLEGIFVDEVDHLLGLLHCGWCPSIETMPDRSEDEGWEYINCATELRDAGIKFKMATEYTSLFDIEFEKGILKIPRLEITDTTETLFRNQIAYEQSRPISYPRDFSNYAMLMDLLINSAKDVKKLRRCGVIENCLGDDKAVSVMFNQLCVKVIISRANQSSYSNVFKKANKHCRRQQNIWLMKLFYLC